MNLRFLDEAQLLEERNNIDKELQERLIEHLKKNKNALVKSIRPGFSSMGGTRMYCVGYVDPGETMNAGCFLFAPKPDGEFEWLCKAEEILTSVKLV